MGDTLTLQNSINFVTPILKNQPLMVSNFEPALSAANLVLGTMLGAPCRWRFNRAAFTITINQAGGTDYTKTIPDFGFLETQWLQDGTGNIYELNGATALARSSSVGRPTRIAAEFDDNQGNLIFRLDRIPNAAYTLCGDYQKSAPLIIAPASPWGVVPDSFNYIFNWGFLAVMSLLINDSRFPIFENYFIARILGAQDGLSDQERNIFMANWMGISQTLVRSQGAVNSGVAARGK